MRNAKGRRQKAKRETQRAEGKLTGLNFICQLLNSHQLPIFFLSSVIFQLTSFLLSHKDTKALRSTKFYAPIYGGLKEGSYSLILLRLPQNIIGQPPTIFGHECTNKKSKPINEFKPHRHKVENNNHQRFGNHQLFSSIY